MMIIFEVPGAPGLTGLTVAVEGNTRLQLFLSRVLSLHFQSPAWKLPSSAVWSGR